MKRIREKMFIYALINPEDGKVFYIGQSKNVYVRVLEHINKSHLNKTPKDKVLSDLFKKGVMPRYEILEEIEVDLKNKTSILNVSEREMYWIKFYSKDGWVSNKQLSPDLNNLNNPYLVEIKCKYCERPTKVKNIKKQFCSSKCRVYYSREVARGTLLIPKIGETILGASAIPVINPMAVIKRKQHNHSLTLTVSPQKEEIPRLKGETSIEYRLRIMELNEESKLK